MGGCLLAAKNNPYPCDDRYECECGASFVVQSNLQTHFEMPLYLKGCDENEEKKVMEVRLDYPNTTDCLCIGFEVGKDGVTEIRKVERYGEFCKIQYYEIYKGNKLCNELHSYSYIRYE